MRAKSLFLSPPVSGVMPGGPSKPDRHNILPPALSRPLYEVERVISSSCALADGALGARQRGLAVIWFNE